MSAVIGPAAIQRIVVALDSSQSGLSALELAAHLAAALGAELEGVFVEDINLVRLARLPFLREVMACSLVEQAISPDSMQRDLHALARQAERTLLRVAEVRGVPCSFRVWRGHTRVETLSTSFDADILSLGGGSTHTVYRAMPVLPARTPQAAFAVDTISVLFSNSPQAHKALVAACHLAKNLGAPVRVLLPSGTMEAGSLERQAAEVLAAHTQQAGFLRISGNSPSSLAAAVGISVHNVLVCEVEHALFRQAGLARCLERLTGPVLFVR